MPPYRDDGLPTSSDVPAPLQWASVFLLPMVVYVGFVPVFAFLLLALGTTGHDAWIDPVVGTLCVAWCGFAVWLGMVQAPSHKTVAGVVLAAAVSLYPLFASSQSGLDLLLALMVVGAWGPVGMRAYAWAWERYWARRDEAAANGAEDGWRW